MPNGDGTYRALLGDPRNDENVIIAGLHCAHILFYNRVLDELHEHDLRRFPGRPPRRPAQPPRAVPDRPRGHAVALPVAAGQRAPAADRRPGRGQRRAPARQPLLPSPGRAGVHADRVRRRRLPVRAQHGPALLSRQLHQRHRRQHQPHRQPVLRARCSTPTNPTFSDPVSHDRADLLGGYPGRATVHRLADLLRSRRRAGQEQQEDRHHDLERPVHPAAARDRAAHADRTDRAAAAKSATPAHLGPALRPGGRARDADAAADQRRPVGHRRRVRPVRTQHPALVLRPRRGRDAWLAGCTSVRSAAASSPRR